MIPYSRRFLIGICAIAGVLSSSLVAQNPTPTTGAALTAPSLIPQDGTPDILTGPVTGGGGIARLFSGTPDHGVLIAGAPFGAISGGVRVAMGDVTGDGVPDLIAAPGAGGGLVRIFNGVDAAEVASGHPFGPAYTGGVHVGAGDVNGDGIDDVLVATALGGSVQIYSLAGGLTHLGGGFPYGPIFTGGVHVAAGDLNGDGRADVITAPATGGGLVRVFNGAGPTVLVDFAPYGTAFTGGVHVATGDVNGDGRADLITSSASGPEPIQVYSGLDASLLISIPTGVAAGVSVAAADLTGDGRAEILGGIGPGGPPLVGILDGTTGGLLGAFRVDDTPTFTGGVLVAAAASRGIRFTSAATTTFTTGTAGSFTVTTNALPTVSAITVTGTLPDGVTFTDNHDGTATLSGTPTPGVGGVHTLTFTATNGDDAPATQTFTLRVEGPPQITSANATTFSVNGAGSFTVTTIGFPRPTLTATGALPPGVTFTDQGDGTATLAGTPQAGSGGIYPLTLTASNGVGTAAIQTFTLTVDASPVFTSTNATTLLLGTAGSFAISASAEPAITTITQTGALPTGVTFLDTGGGSATLSGTPTVTGTFPLTLTAANGVGPNAVQTFTLTVQQAPAITSPNATTFTVGAAGTFDIISTAAPTATLSVTGTLPAGVSFVDDGDGTGQVTGTPTAGGVFPLTISATNGVGTPATQSFTLTVEQGAGIISAAATTFTVGTAGTFSVIGTGTPSPTISVTGTLPLGVTLGATVNGTAVLGGTPDPGTGGTYPIDLTATNGIGAPVTQNFVLTVQQAPAITSAATTIFTVGTAGAFDVQSTGFPIAALSVTGDLPDGVTFVDDMDGSGRVIGTPDPGTSGDYPVTIAATNGVGTDAAQPFTLSVHQIPAIISAASTAFTVGQPGEFDIVATGFPAPTLVIGGAVLPTGVTFTPNGDGTGTLAGTPDPGTGGSYALTFEATNSAGSSGVQTFTLSVNTPPAITSADNTTFTAGLAGSFPVTATGIPAPTIAHTGGTLPVGVAFNTVTNMLEGTATAIGTFAGIQLTATNGIAPDDVQTFTLNVVCPVITVSSAPVTLANGTFNVAYVGATFSQVGGGSGTWSATGLPTGLSIDGTTGVVSGTPLATGTFSVDATFTNTASCTGTANRTFQVAPNAVADTYAAGLGNTQIVAAGDSAPLTPHFVFVSTVLANDQGPAGMTVTPLSGATALGGAVVLNGTGGFTYTPQAGDTGNDSFSYTVTSNGINATGIVTIALGTQRVWYVQQGASGDGRSQAPLGALTTLNGTTVDGPNDYIYVYPGAYAGAITLEAGQTLWGSGAVFSPVANLTIGATTPTPSLQGTVTIGGNDVTVSSLMIESGSSTGITNTGIITGLTVMNDVSVITTTGTAVSFANVDSTNGGSPAFGINFRSVTTNGASTGISLHDVNASAGSFAVTGADGGDPGTDPDPGSGGTIGNAATRGVELVNVGRGVRLGGMSFGSAGSTDSGVATTNCDSYLTGDNTLCHAAIHLVNVGGGIGGQVALNTILVNGGSQVGINARGVTNLTMHQVEVRNVGTDSHESGVMLQNVSGTGAVTNSNFHDNSSRQFHLANASGTLSSFTITGSTFANSDGPNGVQGLLIEGSGASTTMVVTAGGPGAGEGNTFNNLFSNAWQIAAQNSATLTTTLQNSTVTNTNGIVAQASLSSLVTAIIQNNIFTAGPKTGAGVISIKTDGGGSLVGTVSGNTIGQPGVAGSGTACQGCNGMFINARDVGSMDISVVGNTIQNVNGGGIFLSGGEATTQSLNAVITGNLIREPGPIATINNIAVEIRNGVTSGPPADASCIAATIGGTVNPGTWPSTAANAMNQILGAWNTSFGTADVFLWRRFSTTINLPGLSGDPVAWVTARNSFDGTPAVTALSDASVAFGSLATCAP